MPVDHLVVSNFKTGYETDRKPFLINNDAFPVLNNAYIWREQIARKRGTDLLGRLERTLVSESLGNSLASPWTLNVLSSIGFGGYISNITNANPAQVTSPRHNLTSGESIVIYNVNGMINPVTMTSGLNGFTFTITIVDANNFTIGLDTTTYSAYISSGNWKIANQANLTLVPGSITITLGIIVFTDNGNGTLSSVTPGNSGTINYQTGTVVLTHTAGTGIATIVTFSYYPGLPVMGFEDFDIGLVNQPIPVAFDTIYSYEFNQGTNEFYDVTFYKETGTPFVWTGANYQQFYSTNYLGTNTIANTTENSGCLWVTNGKPGFHFQAISTITVGSPTIITTATAHGLVTGDFVFFNEITGADAGLLNNQSVSVTVTGPDSFTVAINTTGKTINNSGIFLTLTSNGGGTSTGDGIKWYDGDPTVSANFGWVNFSPPLNAFNASTNPNPFYLVGADIITPFKNRLIFSGVYLTNTSIFPTIQYYPNRIVYSQVGTPYYANPLPFVIQTQAPDPTAWYQNQVAKGGFLTAPYDQYIVTVSENEDVLIYALETKQLRLIYTFDDTLPFIFQTINSEFGAQNTFSSVILDTGVLGMATNGFTMTTQTSCQRIDLLILDQVFDVSIANNNSSRVTAIRDYRNEWVYFTYCPGDRPQNVFNSKTLLYNYRDNNWATFDENFTHYGTFRRTTFRTWANIGTIYPTWADWTDPWNFAGDAAFFPNIVGGNQHGFVLIKGLGTEEANSQYITAVSGFTITSPNHCLNTGDFIQINGVIGVTGLNGNIFKITPTDANNFTIVPSPTNPVVIVGTYLGGGTYIRYSNPDVQTKQFPVRWQDGRQVRFGLERFLLETTATGQITVNIYSSQNSDLASNDPSINPYLIYQNVVLTSPEPSLYSSAIPPYQAGQDQIWHRQSNSFNGDTIQLGFTLSDAQMYDSTINTQEIKMYAIVLDLYPGPTLA